MKKLFTLLLFMSLLTIGSAQEFKINVSSGYALPAFKQSVEGYYDILMDQSGNKKTEVIKAFSLGSGVHSEFGLQYNFNEWLGIGFDFAYQHGSKVGFERNDAIGSIVSTTHQDLYARSLRIFPSLILKTAEYRLNPYLKLGVILSSTSVQMDEKTTLLADEINREWEYTTEGCYGISFGTGLDYLLNDNLSIRLGLSYQNIRLKPSSAQMVSSKVNGTSNLKSYSTIEKEITYASHIDEAYNISPDQNKPQLLHEIYFPASSFVIQLGISVNLQQ